MARMAKLHTVHMVSCCEVVDFSSGNELTEGKRTGKGSVSIA